jgi:DNA-binding response OmpR family regulator
VYAGYAVTVPLVVDDSPVVRAMLRRAFDAQSVQCTYLESAKEALAHSAAHVSCALLDLELGDGTGIEVALHLRAEAPSLPIAFFSTDPTDEARALGPAFKKPDELESAVAWLVAASSR